MKLNEVERERDILVSDYRKINQQINELVALQKKIEPKIRGLNLYTERLEDDYQ
jgi:uncharacterized protein YllA (UPF0747 family)